MSWKIERRASSIYYWNTKKNSVGFFLHRRTVSSLANQRSHQRRPRVCVCCVVGFFLLWYLGSLYPMVDCLMRSGPPKHTCWIESLNPLPVLSVPFVACVPGPTLHRSRTLAHVWFSLAGVCNFFGGVAGLISDESSQKEASPRDTASPNQRRN